MSSLIVEVCSVDEVRPHPGADRMEIARIRGWEVCVQKDPATGRAWCQPGDRVVYFPPDTVLPPEVAERLGVRKYLGHLPCNEDGSRPPGGRVMVARLRGFKSFGFAAPPEGDWLVGRDVAAHYGASKYEPPVRACQGDAMSPHPAFHVYYDMENLKNFPDALSPMEEVACTEKIHGENCRLGLIREAQEGGGAIWRWMAGTRSVRRKPGADCWRYFSEPVRALLAEASGCGYSPAELDESPPVRHGLSADVILFGERYGAGVQDLWYGHTRGGTSFRAFDLSVNGIYLDHEPFWRLCGVHGVTMTPLLYQGGYDFAALVELAEGRTEAGCASGGCSIGEGAGIREGLVVRPVQERRLNTHRGMLERAVFKVISFAYSERKNGTEYR